VSSQVIDTDSTTPADVVKMIMNAYAVQH
jgi:hypothetical protein